ncbi:acylneuraminate cytidylyltransferase family protein [Candidatus Methylopumilus universalis]|uniref:Acylneuraminate cytidylyltransferase family protein n=1 Tax=Candidatus Methylopumilus universalis TaxID=2588536 RepID=A0ABX5VTS4_9PROT|nr:acylneuraminate cytidylyltransferase family protein [Candidatus Methylopumilus universalis]QDC51248.1 acylneuraminate cytidylyltransferase family protein [Candidatus Methylopumilus universalis]QDC61386.1 acylneuraminate cytidylyltransferase family protein [Candidatus Methylopumilus universalis]
MTFNSKLVLALIPGRGGSKGVKRKNLRVVLGKPLIEHTIQAASDSLNIDRIFVSSDDTEILELARENGVDAIKRASMAASDSATAVEVVYDFLKQIPEDLIVADPYIIYLQPTSPLRKAAHINAAFDVMISSRNDICISVTKLKKTPFKSYTLSVEGLLEPIFDEAMTNANRQSLPEVYCPNGAIYIFSLAKFLEHGAFPSNGGVPYIMSERDSVDIDTEEDLILLEKLCLKN